MNILGIKIDNFPEVEIVRKANDFLNEDKFHQIATVNPEFILEAQKDNEFRNILNQCDLNIADGVGIKFAFWRKGERLKSRIAGADLMDEILKIANEKKLGVFLVANNRGLSSYEDTREAILKRYPNLEIGGENIDKKISNFQIPISNKIQNSENYEVIFCNFGVPFQEKFLYSLKTLKNANIKLAMGVGGGFDYLTGKIRRAPVLMRKLGMEWLWRLILEPRYRFKRIINAIIIFPIKIIFNSCHPERSEGSRDSSPRSE